MKKTLILAVLAIAAALGLFALARSCQPEPSAPSPKPSPSSTNSIVVDTAGRPASSTAPTVAQLAVSPGRGVIAVEGSKQPIIVQQQAPAVRVVAQSPAGRQTVVGETPARPIEVAMIPAGSDAIVVTSKPEPVEIVIKELEPSRVGIIAGVLPGWVALDVALIRGRPLQPLGLDVAVSLDVMAGPGAVGAGVAVGDKFFVTGGGCVEWSGRPGWYVAGGVRF